MPGKRGYYNLRLIKVVIVCQLLNWFLALSGHITKGCSRKRLKQQKEAYTKPINFKLREHE